MGREVVGDSGWETHVHPWLTQVNVWQIIPQYCKVMSLQLKKKKDIQCHLDSVTCHKHQMQGLSKHPLHSEKLNVQIYIDHDISLNMAILTLLSFSRLVQDTITSDITML